MAYSWGSGSDGQLGLGDKEDYSHPMKLNINFNIKQIIGGGSHTIALSDKGYLFMCGNGEDGKLCKSETSLSLSFEDVSMLQNENIKIVCAGWNHSIAIKEDGSVLSWGNNQFGQLGTEDVDDGKLLKLKFNWKPSIVKHALDKIKVSHVSCGLRHTIAISHEGRSYSWGENRHGQCGVEHLKRVYNPIEIEHLKDIHALESSAGTRHSLILCKEGNVYAFGCNRFGQCGVKPSKRLSPIKIQFKENLFIHKVRCGWNHSIIISKDQNKVISFGRNDYGQLGLGHFDPVELPNLIETLNGIEIEDIAIGSEHNMAIAKDGNIYTWGWAEHGQLGHGNETNQCKPLKVETLNHEKQLNGIGCGYGCSFAYERHH